MNTVSVYTKNIPDEDTEDIVEAVVSTLDPEDIVEFISHRQSMTVWRTLIVQNDARRERAFLIMGLVFTDTDGFTELLLEAFPSEEAMMRASDAIDQQKKLLTN